MYFFIYLFEASCGGSTTAEEIGVGWITPSPTLPKCSFFSSVDDASSCVVFAAVRTEASGW